jgi:large subunit ribosomal protein L21
VPSRRSYIYAVIRSGGKQYKVEPNQLLDVELLPADVGAVVELSDVLLVADGDDVTVGQPLVDGARVVAEVVEHGRGPKIIVFKYKNKTRYRRRTGHRQSYTRLAIRQILVGAEPAAVAAPTKARRRRAPAKPTAEPEAAPPEAKEAAVVEEQPEAAVIPATEAPVAEEAPAADEPVSMEAAPPEEAPKTHRRRPAAPKATEEAPPKPARPRPTGRAKRGE